MKKIDELISSSSFLASKPIEQKMVFGLTNKKLVTTYTPNSNAGAIAANWYAARGRSLSSFNRAELVKLLDKPTDINNIKKAVSFSNALYATDNIYAGIINYLKDMFLYRYKTVPRRVKFDTPDAVPYEESYREMIEVVDGANIAVVFPRILLNLFKEGSVFIYTVPDKSSKTISTMILPSEYCLSGDQTQYGTFQVLFDFRYFTKEENKDKLEFFPKEFQKLFAEYESEQKSAKGLSAWKILDGRHSAAFLMNDFGFPSLIALYLEMLDYDIYKTHELQRNENQLSQIIVQEIDLEKTRLTLDEVEALHRSTSKSVCDNVHQKMITTVGKVHTEDLLEKSGSQGDILNQAFNRVFQGAGLNQSLFNHDSVESLKYSNRRDQNFVWFFMEQLMNFYNLTINNSFKFYNYQLSFSILPITTYNEADKLKFYQTNASFGVGKLDLIIASGIKQVNLDSEFELERMLQLDKNLQPLKSSHTSSSSDADGEKEISKEDVDIAPKGKPKVDIKVKEVKKNKEEVTT